MIKNVLQDIHQVGAYGLVSMLIFFGFFAAMLVWAWLLKRPYLETMRTLPLGTEETEGAGGADASELNDGRERSL